MDISRHKELFNPYYFNHPITIIGAGATGSWLTLSLAKLGLTDITVWDFDVVEEHNIPNQLYFAEGNGSELLTDVGWLKTDALQRLVRNATGIEINIHNNRFTNQRLAGVVYLMVDSMAERWRIWNECIKLKSAVKLLIEPRMGINTGYIYNVNPMSTTHIKKYEESYYSDEEAEVSACGGSMSVISSALGVTSWCIRQLINWHNFDGINEELDNEILIDFKYNNVVSYKW